ncbi:hypothetical protein LguiB_035396 [Lonicera macranthoides]
MVGPVRPEIVLVGSSIVQYSYDVGGWGAALANLYSRKADIIKRGYAGWNSRRAVQILKQLFSTDAAVQPTLAIIYFGGNDAMRPRPSGLGPHVPLDEYKDNMRTIANHILSLSENTRIIFRGPPPVNEDYLREVLGDLFEEKGRTNKDTHIYSEACREVCNEMNDNVEFIDLFYAIQQREDWLNSSFTDGLHLSAEGSKTVMREIEKVLKEAVWVPSLHWDDMSIEFGEESPYDP